MRPFLTTFFLGALLLMAATGCSHIRKSTGDLREGLLREIPAGTSMRDVERLISQRYTLDGAGTAADRAAALPSDRKFVTRIGQYAEFSHVLPLKTHVFATWIFDGERRLSDVIVYKETDGL